MPSTPLYDPTDRFVAGQVPTAAEWNRRVLDLHQAEFERRWQLLSGWFTIPVLTATGAAIQADMLDALVGGCRVTGPGAWSFTGQPAGLYLLDVNAAGDCVATTTEQPDQLIAGTVTWSGTAFTDLTCLAAVGLMLRSAVFTLGDRAAAGEITFWLEGAAGRAGLRRTSDGQLVYTMDSGASWHPLGGGGVSTHTALTDMPDTPGANTDHDARYVTKVSAAPPLDNPAPFTGMLWYDTDTPPVPLGAADIADGAITTPKLADGAVTAAKTAADIVGDGLLRNTDGSLKVHVGTGLSIDTDGSLKATGGSGGGLTELLNYTATSDLDSRTILTPNVWTSIGMPQQTITVPSGATEVDILVDMSMYVNCGTACNEIGLSLLVDGTTLHGLWHDFIFVIYSYSYNIYLHGGHIRIPLAPGTHTLDLQARSGTNAGLWLLAGSDPADFWLRMTVDAR